MTYEGVTFNEEAAARMGRSEFIARHAGAFWRDRSKAVRRKMLAEAYGLMAKAAKEE